MPQMLVQVPTMGTSDKKVLMLHLDSPQQIICPTGV